jgi:CHAT domain-containing protein
VIHFATHAVFDGEMGRLSRLLLRNGDLFVDDIRLLRLAADLVALSGCQTGLGQVFSGDEIVGLAYSFLAAGVQTIIASLWHINDPGATSLMARFYGELSLGKSPAMALALAQRFAIAAGWPPYFWAPFTPIGLP